MRFHGLVYRAMNPIYARTPLSGEGARRHGGRFNPRGMAALYTAQSVAGAIREANQIGTLQPTTLVAMQADIAPVFDAADAAALAGQGMSPADLAADDWRARMLAGDAAPTQALAERLVAAGYAAMQVPSFAKGADAGALNLILWRWGSDLPARLVVVDDEGRLSAPPR